MKRAGALLSLLAASVALMSSGLIAQQPGLSASRRADHLAAFDQIWTTVRDRHWDPTLHGVDWDAAKRELRPRVEIRGYAVKSLWDAYRQSGR